MWVVRLDVFFSGRRRNTRLRFDWSSDVCSSDLPVEMNGRTVYAIFAANGRQLAVTENLDAAHGLLFQNGLEPQGLH